MKQPQPNTPEPRASSTWERLEGFVREHVQRFIQVLLAAGYVGAKGSRGDVGGAVGGAGRGSGNAVQ